MKMAKATEQDMEAAGKMMALLDSMSRGYYPSREGEDDAPTMFDADNPDHLRRFHDEAMATIDASPGWPCRVIGGMCFVILFEANKIIDPAADTLELHPDHEENARHARLYRAVKARHASAIVRRLIGAEGYSSLKAPAMIDAWAEAAAAEIEAWEALSPEQRREQFERELAELESRAGRRS